MATHFFSHHLEEAEMLATETVLQRSPRHASALNVRLAILRHMRSEGLNGKDYIPAASGA
jgi:hypothetical protein